MDTAALKVSHSVGRDKDATALLAARARSSSIGALKNTSRKVRKTSTHEVGAVRKHVGVDQ